MQQFLIPAASAVAAAIRGYRQNARSKLVRKEVTAIPEMTLDELRNFLTNKFGSLWKARCVQHQIITKLCGSNACDVYLVVLICIILDACDEVC